ncbi:MAG: SH3 domain-containing protein [Myxococcales bacterium]|jgi:hypothetical protein|nr:SH3 domain-containing protein [Myxococcales bacterium]
MRLHRFALPSTLATLAPKLTFAALVVGAVALPGCSAEVEGAPPDDQNADELRGNHAVGTDLRTTADLNHRAAPNLEAAILQVIPEGTIVKSAAAQPRSGWYGITWNGRTGWVFGEYLVKPSSASGGSAASDLLEYHAAGSVQLWDQTFGRRDGADPLSNIRDAAAGRSARTSCYGTAPCTTVRLSSALVTGLAALRSRYGFRYFVTAIAGASHSSGSYHYAGRAVDVGEIDGVNIAGNTALTRRFMAACTALGAIEVLGPSNRSDHQDHIHCAW